jgi:hypothetical protein
MKMSFWQAGDFLAYRWVANQSMKTLHLWYKQWHKSNSIGKQKVLIHIQSDTTPKAAAGTKRLNQS